METTLEAPLPTRSRGRIALILTPCLLFVSLLTYGIIAKGHAPLPGDQAPAFEAPMLDGGGTLALDDFKGKPVFLNFWGSWCEPCKEEAPILARAEKLYGGDVVFVGVNIRDGLNDAIAFAQKYNLDYQHVRDDSLTIYGDYGLTGQPESFFIDRDGEVVEHVAGPLSEENLARALDVLVARDG